MLIVWIIVSEYHAVADEYAAALDNYQQSMDEQYGYQSYQSYQNQAAYGNGVMAFNADVDVNDLHSLLVDPYGSYGSYGTYGP